MWCIIGLSLTSQYWPAFAAIAPLTKQQISQEFKHFKNIKKLDSQFKQVRLVKEWETEVVTNGRFQINRTKNKSLLWEITHPSYMAVSMKPDGLLFKTEEKSDKWKALGNAKMADQLKSLFSWLAFDVEALHQDFIVSKTKNDEFQLTPKNKAMTFQKIIISLDGKRLVKKIKMFEANQDSIDISFSKTQLKK